MFHRRVSYYKNTWTYAIVIDQNLDVEVVGAVEGTTPDPDADFTLDSDHYESESVE